LREGPLGFADGGIRTFWDAARFAIYSGFNVSEGFVGRRKHGEGTFARQRVDEIGSLHGGDEGGVILLVDGILNDVLRREHRGAADRHRHLLGAKTGE
jgi:hypothetical protein